MPPWVTAVIPTHRGDFWAPDVIRQGQRCLVYYSVSRFGKNRSAIALASNPTRDPGDVNYRWTDHGIVIASSEADDFNAIDPAVIATDGGKLWMTFGSFWSGIKLLQLHPQTGLRLSGSSPMYSLGRAGAIEAPDIYASGGFYYLFVNWGLCCRGVESTYNIRVGRSHEMWGPYVDQDGKPLLEGGGTLLLESDGAFVGPGHASILETPGGQWLCCRFYDGTDRGRSHLAILPLTWTDDGWPTVQNRHRGSHGKTGETCAGRPLRELDPWSAKRPVRDQQRLSVRTEPQSAS